MKLEKTFWVQMGMGLAFVAWAWFRLVEQNSDLLYEAQDQGYWQPGMLYFNEIALQPFGWLSWLGQYLTQYFYYPALGSSILIILWLVIYSLCTYALKPVWYLSWVGLILPVLLLFHVTSPGYFVYVNKVADWWFTPTLICLVFSLLFAVVCRFLPNKGRIVAACLLLVCVGGSYYRMVSLTEMPASLNRPFHPMLDNANFRAELRMERALEAGQWQTALTEMRHAGKNPTRSMWLMKNIALLNQGRLATDWLEYPCLTKLPAFNDSILVPQVESVGPFLYFMHGNIQFAYRWSMENTVEYGPSMKRLRLMVRCALLKGEWDLANKYLNLLSRTLFHKEWAESQRRFVGHPELLAQDPVYRIADLISRSRINILDSDQSRVENYILNIHTQDMGHSCLEMAELSLIYTMQTQDISRFWKQFFLYANLHNGKPMPLLFQQAVYLFIKLEPQSAPRQDFPFDPMVPKMYEQFQARVQQLTSRGCSEAELPAALQREFGRSYFWFYFFCRNLTTY